MRALSPVLKAALLAGLFEGGLIASQLLLSGAGAPRGPFDFLVDAARVVGLHLAVGLVLGFLFLPFTRQPFFLLRAVVSVWALAAFAARRMLEEESGPGAQPLLVVVLIALWLTPRAWLQRLRPAYRLALGGAGVLVISVYSLWGRAPDFRHGLELLGWLHLGSAVVAVVVVLALSAWPRPAAAAIAAVVAAAAFWAYPRRMVPADRPSVLFILSDTSRRDHISPFGTRVRTPAIEHLASRGVLFGDAVTVIPKTSQSVASFLTGRYPARHGLRGLYDSLSPSQPNLVKAFQSAGYETIGLVNNPWVSPSHGFAHGFDRYYIPDEIRRDFGGSFEIVTWGVLYDQLVRKRLEWRPPQPKGFFEARDSDLSNAAIRVLDGRRRPFFLYVHYFQPHWPYYPPPPLQRRYDAPPPEKSVVNHIDESEFTRGQMIFENRLPETENEGARRLYRGEMDDTMAEIGRLLAALERSAFRDETIVVFTADHGHALGEHDYYFHHGDFLYDSCMRIPLILSWPAHLPEGLVVEHQVRSIDLAPTLLELARVELDAPLDGRSLSGYWSGREDGPRGAFMESDVRMMEANRRREVGGVLGKLRAWRDGRLKLILTPAIAGPRFELFDLVRDPEEKRDLSGDESRQPDLRALRELLTAAMPEGERAALLPIDAEVERRAAEAERRAAEAERRAAAPKPGIGQRDLELLRQLGYVE
jgi:arylsulfatase A-like enzyme